MTDPSHPNSRAGAPFLDGVDWNRPWLTGVRHAFDHIVQSNDWRAALNLAANEAGLENHLGNPIRFVPQSCLPPGVAYEAFISATGGVPTRDNLHDFFNALVWLTFPKIKIQLNALQAAELERTCTPTGAPRKRGRVRDAATIFDENAALLVVKDAGLLDAMRAHRWSEVFVERRDAFWHECEVWLFGHALMEKLARPYKAITAHAWPVLADASFFQLPKAAKIDWMDEAISGQLADGLATTNFTPLPVLGVPGWWDGQDAHFYDDAAVFRPKRRARDAG